MKIVKQEETVVQIIEQIATINARKYEPRQRVRAVQDNRGELFALLDWCDAHNFSYKKEREIFKKIRMKVIYESPNDELGSITLQFMY